MPDANYHISPFAGFVIGHGDQWLVSRDVELLQQPGLTKLLVSTEIKKRMCLMPKQ